MHCSWKQRHVCCQSALLQRAQILLMFHNIQPLCVCVCVRVRLCIQSLLQHKRLPVNCALIRLPRNVHCVGGGSSYNAMRQKRVNYWRQMQQQHEGLFERGSCLPGKRFFFSSSRLLRNRGPSFRYAVQLIQWKMRCFFNPTFNILPPLCTHTISLPLSLLLCVCSCCMPASVFISGSSQHGRHVLCYC